MQSICPRRLGCVDDGGALRPTDLAGTPSAPCKEPWAVSCAGDRKRVDHRAEVGGVAGRQDAAEHGHAERRADLARRVVHRRADAGLSGGTDDMISSVIGVIVKAMPSAITTIPASTCEVARVGVQEAEDRTRRPR